MRIKVINPNTTQSMTEKIDEAADLCREILAVRIDGIDRKFIEGEVL